MGIIALSRSSTWDIYESVFFALINSSCEHSAQCKKQTLRPCSFRKKWTCQTASDIKIADTVLALNRKDNAMKNTEGRPELIIGLWIDGIWKRVYTTEQIGENLSYCKEYVAQLCNAEELIAYKINGQWLIPTQWHKNNYIDLIPF